MAGNEIPPLVVGAKFHTYSAFKEALNFHQQQTTTQFVIAQGEKISQSDPLCDQFQYTSLRLQCKQGKRYKKAEPTKDQRPCQRSFKVGCPVQLTLRLNRRPKDNPRLKITKLNLDHDGHGVSRQVFQLFPEQRRIQVDEVDMTVLGSTTMRTAEQRQILEDRHSVPVLRQSVYNLQQKMGVGRINGERDDVKCEALIRDILADGGHGEVGRDEEGTFQYCCFTTAYMKDMLLSYPETLILDCTYKLNHYLYPCLTVMVLDGEGHGQPVFHAFVAREDKNILENCLRVFAQQYSTSSTCCFVVDKDMAEIAAIGAVFPGVPVLLCHFHISQAVERFLKGKLSKAVADVVLDSFMTQVTTESEDEFAQLKLQISEVVPQPVGEYFEQNWWSKRHLWAACCNINVVRLHATTTNALESYHAKIKKQINEKYSLSNAMSALVQFDHDKLTEAKRKRLLTANSDVYNHRDQDGRSVEITKTLSRFGAQLVKVELELSTTVEYFITEHQTGEFTVSYKDRQHKTTPTMCSCSTFGHLKIPCRHIFALRKYLNVELFNLEIVPTRFQQSTQMLENPLPNADESSGLLNITTLPAVPFSLRTVEGRYKTAKIVCDRAAGFLSILGCEEFRQKLRELEEFIERWSVNCNSEINSEHAGYLDVRSPVSSPVAAENSHTSSANVGELLCVVDLQANTVEFPHSPQMTVNPVPSISPSAVLSSSNSCSVSMASPSAHRAVAPSSDSVYVAPSVPNTSVSMSSPSVCRSGASSSVRRGVAFSLSAVSTSSVPMASPSAHRAVASSSDSVYVAPSVPNTSVSMSSPSVCRSGASSSVRRGVAFSLSAVSTSSVPMASPSAHRAVASSSDSVYVAPSVPSTSVSMASPSAHRAVASSSDSVYVAPSVPSTSVSMVSPSVCRSGASSSVRRGVAFSLSAVSTSSVYVAPSVPSTSVSMDSPSVCRSGASSSVRRGVAFSLSAVSTSVSMASPSAHRAVAPSSDSVYVAPSVPNTSVSMDSPSVRRSGASSSVHRGVASPSLCRSGASSTCTVSLESPSVFNSEACSLPVISVPSGGEDVVASDFSVTLERGPSSSETSFSWPTMSRLLKPRGRPCSKQRFTKLSTKNGRKRRRCIPKAFNQLTEAEKTSLLLGSVSVFSDKPSRLIQTEDLKSVMTFSDTVLDDKVNLNLIENFFDSSAWALVSEGVEHRKEQSAYFCGDCRDRDNGEFKMVQCEHCLVWYHFECVGYSSKKKVQTWFCDDCCRSL